MPTTLEFHLQPETSERYRLEVFLRSNSQPVAHAAFDYALSFMTQFEMGRLDVDAKDPAARFSRLQEYGHKLYQKLFTSEIQTLWQQHKRATDFLTLCLRIAPEAAGLEALPWETLYDGEEFLAAGAKTGMSRLPRDIAPQENLPGLALPLKMLALFSSPLDLHEHERLQMEREQELLLQAVNAPAGEGRLHVDCEDEAKLAVLESSLEADYHIWHYSGHGIAPQNGGGLLLEDAEGKRRPTAVHEILQALQKAENSLRLAVLSGCQTATTLHVAGFRDLARGLSQAGVPSVIAMQFSISDNAGLLLAETLYPKLAAGQPLEMALSATRRVLLQHDEAAIKADAFAPVLLTANGQCLKTDDTVRTLPASGQSEVKIDFSFHLPLAQLSFGFYGRRREYRHIRDGLLQRNHRAVIVHGLGGLGKTSLASHVAHRLRRNFKGVYAFNCSSGALSPERIVLELHRYFERLGVQALQPLVHNSLPPADLATYLAQVLCQFPLLLIFDNFETQLSSNQQRATSDQQQATNDSQSTTNDPRSTTHTISDPNLRAYLITLLKATATGTRFFFTSRYLFDLEAQRLGTIQELALADLSRPEALGLMQKLPHLAHATFAEKLAAYKTFGGHPYALVTLDRHAAFQPLSKILQDAQSVHAELREFLVIALNYGKLSERARALLNRMAAFRQAVPPEAAEWVMGEPLPVAELFLEQMKMRDRKEWPEEAQAMNETELLQFLQQMLPQQRQAENLDRPIAELISWGLLTPINEDGQLAALSVHNLVRDFCCDQQAEATWRERLHEAAVFYTNQTKLLQQDDKTPAAVWNEMEAFELLLEAENFEAAADLLMNAHPLLDRWGFGRFLENQYRRLLGKVARPTAAKLVHNLGMLVQARGDYAAALTEYEKSLKIKEEIGNRAGVASSLHEIGMIHQARGDYAAALAEYEKSLKTLEELGNRAGVAASLHQIGMIHQARGDYAAALTEYEKSLKIKEELGNRAGVASSLHQIGMIHQKRGDYAAALAEYEKSLKTLEEIGDRAGVASSLHNIGAIHQERGDYAAALAEYEKSLKIEEELGNRAGVAISLHQIGMIHQARGDYAAALAEYEKSLKIAEELGDRAGVASSLHHIGMIYQARGDYAAALTEYEKSLKIAEEIGDRAGVASSLHQIGTIHQARGDYAAAFEHLLFALAAFAELQSPNARIAVNALKALRTQWGAANFDAAWQQATGTQAPEGLLEE